MKKCLLYQCSYCWERGIYSFVVIFTFSDLSYQSLLTLSSNNKIGSAFEEPAEFHVFLFPTCLPLHLTRVSPFPSPKSTRVKTRESRVILKRRTEWFFMSFRSSRRRRTKSCVQQELSFVESVVVWF